MKVLGIAAVLAFLSVSPAFAADPTIRLATMTCKQFADSPKDTVNTIITWMMGYNQDSDEPAEIVEARSAVLAPPSRVGWGLGLALLGLSVLGTAAMMPAATRRPISMPAWCGALCCPLSISAIITT